MRLLPIALAASLCVLGLISSQSQASQSDQIDHDLNLANIIGTFMVNKGYAVDYSISYPTITINIGSTNGQDAGIIARLACTSARTQTWQLPRWNVEVFLPVGDRPAGKCPIK
jgi:hypothetical protein